MITLEQALFISIIFSLVFLVSDRGLPSAILLGSGLFLRLVVGWLDQAGLINLPWSGSDSEAFYAQAVDYVQLSWREFFYALEPQQSYVYAWFMGFIMRFMGTDYFYLRVLNMLLGGFIAIIIHRSLIVSGSSRRIALLGMSLYLFFPFAIILNSVLLRESIIAFFISLIGLGLVNYYKGRMSGFGLATAAAGGATLFHGAMAVLLILVLLMAACLPPRKSGPGNARVPLVRKEYRILFGICVMSVIAYIMLFGEFSKIGNATNAYDKMSERLDRVSLQGSKGESGYPSWLTENVSNPIFWAPRFVYFMAAPFPWDWRNVVDMLSGMLSIFYIVAFSWAVKARKLSASFKAIFIILFVALLAFSIGTDNIGTSIRHRTKFLPLLLVVGLAWINYKRAMAAEDVRRL